MGILKFRQIVNAILIFGIVIPSPAIAAKTKIFKTTKGQYSVLNYLNSKTKEQSQMVLAPDSRSNRYDRNGDGVWDHWEFNKANLTLIAEGPYRGHFTQLQYHYRLQQGELRADFIYHEKSKSYYLVGKKFEKYKVLKSENIVIGQCAQRSDVKVLAEAWNQVRSKIFDLGRINLLEADTENRFIDASCKQGIFKDSYPTMINGLAQVLQYSGRDEPDPDFDEASPPRFMSCMDRHGLGVHSDRMRSFLYRKLEPSIADYLYNKNIPGNKNISGSGLETSPNAHIEHNLFATGLGVNENSQIPVAENSAESEYSADSLKAQKELDEKIKTNLYTPLLKCQYKANLANGVERANWSQNNLQITFNRKAGERIPASMPRYTKDWGLKNTEIKEHHVDAYDYARAFFHELLHSSFIDNEGFTEAIENCCGADNGYSSKNPGCQAMTKYIQKESGHQSYIYALMQKDPDAYSNYHQNLISELGSIDNANRLESSVIYKFKSETTQCNQDRSKCGLTLERVLMDSAGTCMAGAGSSDSKKKQCEQKFNRDFYIGMHGLYEKECAATKLPRETFNCNSLATSFLNLFGECAKHVGLDFENKWDFLLAFIIGKNSFADDPGKCACFEITNSARSEYAELGNNSRFDSNEHIPYVSDIQKDLEDGHGKIPSFVSPGQSSDNYNRESEKPVTKEMLGETAAIPNSQLTKEFTRGYERRSTSLVDSAISVYNRIQKEILPSAYADTANSLAEVALNNRLSSNQLDSKNSSMRISDPFQSASDSSSDSANSLNSSVQMDYSDPSGSLNRPNASAASESSPISFGSSIGNSANSSIGHNGASLASSDSTRPSKRRPGVPPHSNTSNGPGNSGALVAASSRAGRARGLQQDPNANSNTSANSNSGSQDSDRKTKAAKASEGRVPASKGGSAELDIRSQKNKEKKSYRFANSDELLKFLTSDYRKVDIALGDPELIKILIDQKVKVLNHQNRKIGSRQPDYILQFNKANGALNIVKWK
jgi:hypothetical protein